MKQYQFFVILGFFNMIVYNQTHFIGTYIFGGICLVWAVMVGIMELK